MKLKAFHKFEDTAEAVQSATALVEGKLSAGMKKFLKKSIVSKELQARPSAASPRAHHLRAPRLRASSTARAADTLTFVVPRRLAGHSSRR